ncbi:MAG: malate synthase [Bacteroidia bacterium]
MDVAKIPQAQKFLFSDSAVRFLEALHIHFEEKVSAALKKRQQDREVRLRPDPFMHATRIGEWKVRPQPEPLKKRYVEITGPPEAKMLINALNSGANGYMADFEDAYTPHWHNLLEGQYNLYQAIRGQLSVEEKGKKYTIQPQQAFLWVRPRGWHLVERNLRVNGNFMRGALVDFGLFFFHNAYALLEKGAFPAFYLPKLESYEEAAVWEEVFVFSESYLGLPLGTIRATVLIETLPAAFQMEEILYVLREHITALNAGRWDYLFSVIKIFSDDRNFVLPDRNQLTMRTKFMEAYAKKLVQVCHKRGALAIGGMSAYIPSRKNPEINQTAIANVIEDKKLEIARGFDGAWVAHPDLVEVVQKTFEEGLKGAPNQKDWIPEEEIPFEALLDFPPAEPITEKTFHQNLRVALLYVDSWLKGRGAVAIDNLMEDTATAEIARAQLWQWLHTTKTLSFTDSGKTCSKEFFYEALHQVASQLPDLSPQTQEFVKKLVDSPEMVSFLTTFAQEYGFVAEIS